MEFVTIFVVWMVLNLGVALLAKKWKDQNFLGFLILSIGTTPFIAFVLTVFVNKGDNIFFVPRYVKGESTTCVKCGRVIPVEFDVCEYCLEEKTNNGFKEPTLLLKFLIVFTLFAYVLIIMFSLN